MKRPFGRSGLASGVAAVAAMLLTSAFAGDAAAQRNSRNPGGQKKPAAAAPKLDRARGAAEAPAVLQAAGVSCTVSDAAFVGASKNAAGTVINNYEVACSEGLGYLLQAPTGGTPQPFDCLAVEAARQAAAAKGQSAALGCQLPANAKPAVTLQPLVAAAGGTCTVNDARYVGTSASSGVTIYEVRCTQGAGYMLQRPRATGSPTLTSCLNFMGTPTACTLTPQAEVVASLVPVVAQAKRQCDVNNARMVGQNPATKNSIVEIGCSNGPGFLAETAGNGAFVRALDCDKVQGVTCQFTDVSTLQAANQAALMTRVRNAGLGDCTPGQVRVIGAEAKSGREVVEVSCSNRPYGAIAILGSQVSPRAEVYDCLFAPRWAGECTLTQASAAYPRVSSALRLRGKNPNCSITNARWMGVTPQAENWFEIACQDGRSFLIDYRGNGQVASMLTCREGAGIGGGCRAGIGASVPKD